MSDRIIRDELLRSHRYVTLSSDTLRILFVHLILSTDSLGNAEATTTALGAAMGRQVDEATAAKWLSELADVDLVRIYQAGGKRYVHVPRFRQRLRYVRGKHPRPPAEIECSEIKELLAKAGQKSDHSRTTVGPQSAEVKRSEENLKHAASKSDAAIVVDPRKRLFDLGVSLLTAYGSSESSARSFLALQLKNGHGGEAHLAEVVGYLAANPKIEPRAYIAAAMKPPDAREAMLARQRLLP